MALKMVGNKTGDEYTAVHRELLETKRWLHAVDECPSDGGKKWPTSATYP